MIVVTSALVVVAVDIFSRVVRRCRGETVGMRYDLTAIISDKMIRVDRYGLLVVWRNKGAVARKNLMVDCVFHSKKKRAPARIVLTSLYGLPTPSLYTDTTKSYPVELTFLFNPKFRPVVGN